MTEGSSTTTGEHDTTWDNAFPAYLKPPSYVKTSNFQSLQDTKSFSAMGPGNDAIPDDSIPLQLSNDDINGGQQTDRPLVASSDANINAAAADSTFNLNGPLGSNPVQPVAPEIHSENVAAGNPPLLSNSKTPDLTALEFDGGIIGV